MVLISFKQVKKKKKTFKVFAHLKKKKKKNTLDRGRCKRVKIVQLFQSNKRSFNVDIDPGRN